MARLGHAWMQYGSAPARTMSGQKSHFMTVPFRAGTCASTSYSAKRASVGTGGAPQLKNRRSYGQAAMQIRHPMHRSWSIRTTPSGVEKVAATGHTFTHGGFWQCWHGVGRKRGPSPSPLALEASIHRTRSSGGVASGERKKEPLQQPGNAAEQAMEQRREPKQPDRSTSIDDPRRDGRTQV